MIAVQHHVEEMLSLCPGTLMRSAGRFTCDNSYVLLPDSVVLVVSVAFDLLAFEAAGGSVRVLAIDCSSGAVFSDTFTATEVDLYNGLIRRIHAP